MNNIRNNVEDIVKSTLLGPLHGPEEELLDSPFSLYITGILYPNTEVLTDLNDKEEEIYLNKGVNPIEREKNVKKGRKKSIEDTEENKDELTLVTDFSPKALGMSCLVDSNTSFNVNINFGTYVTFPLTDEAIIKKKDGKKMHKGEYKYIRKSHEVNNIKVNITPDSIKVKIGEEEFEHSRKISISPERHPEVKLSFVKRKYTLSDKKRHVVTVTLLNNIKIDTNYTKNPENCLFQSSMKCFSNKDVFLPFVDEIELNKIIDPEELSNKLLYGDYKKYASGHGVSVTWEEAENPKLKNRHWVSTEYIPQFEVLDNDFNLKGLKKEDSNILFIKPLAGETFSKDGLSRPDMIRGLEDFIKHYKDWIDLQKMNLTNRVQNLGYPQRSTNVLIETGDKNLDACTNLFFRMKTGVALLKNNHEAFRSFTDANRAMYIQRAMGYDVDQRQIDGEFIAPNEQNNINLPGYSILPGFSDFGGPYFAKWRPFQLAFLLSQIEGMIYPESEDREVMDLIWFSTGGGKTEAYLGLIAMYLFHRRLFSKKEKGDPDEGAGVSAIMRYTLRLLIKDQYGRATPLILACELIRREFINDYGKIPFSIGIWVGQSLTPNKRDGKGKKSEGFKESFDALKIDPEKKTRYSLPFYNCPACGTSLIKRKENGKTEGEWGCFGTSRRGNEDPPYHLHCTNNKCSFHVPIKNRADKDLILSQGFPVYFIDDDIYEHMPSLIFSTVDKFASINWNTSCYKLFNISFSSGEYEYKYPPPELIIQDELHLISSGLGTVVGVYEIAFENLCTDLYSPKIVTATATVRNAESQCRLLYGRSKYQQFPPPGISADDSFYSRKKELDKEKLLEGTPQGRKYFGLQPTGFTNTVAQIRLVSTLMQRTPAINASNVEYDPYFTNLIYFNTIKELGKFRTLLMDDISANKRFLSSTFGEYGTLDKGFRSEEFAELSSQLDADSITKNLNILKNSKLPTEQNQRTNQLYKLGIRRPQDILNAGKAWNREYKNKFNNISLFKELNIKDFEESEESEESEAIKRNRIKFENHVKESFSSQDLLVPQIVAATNMISVGVDIARFNIMQITGQPKTHAEYIQASSRAGRAHKGLVITTFNPAKNRDRSHYESFVDYHQGFYRYVEATSVTPYSLPALEKSLDAVCFCIVQARFYHGSGSAPWSDELDDFMTSLEKSLLRRIDRTGEGYNGFTPNDIKNWKENVKEKIKDLKDYWNDHSQNHQDAFIPNYGSFHSFLTRDKRLKKIEDAVYVRSDMKEEDLSLSTKKGCMTSMRSVELSIPLILSNDYNA